MSDLPHELEGKRLHVLEAPNTALADSKASCEIIFGGDVNITRDYRAYSSYGESHTRLTPGKRSVDDVYVSLDQSESNPVPAILCEAQRHRNCLHFAIVDIQRSTVKRFNGYLKSISTSGDFVIAVDGGVTKST